MRSLSKRRLMKINGPDRSCETPIFKRNKGEGGYWKKKRLKKSNPKK